MINSLEIFHGERGVKRGAGAPPAHDETITIGPLRVVTESAAVYGGQHVGRGELTPCGRRWLASHSRTIDSNAIGGRFLGIDRFDGRIQIKSFFGDVFPWFFHREKIVPIVGTRTWG